MSPRTGISAVATALAQAALARPPAKWRREHPTHKVDEDRSAKWNAWRQRQALHPVATFGPVRPSVKPRPRTAAEIRSRRLSTRASRRRAQKQEGSR